MRVTVEFEVREVGSDEVTLHLPYTEGVLSEQSAQSLIDAAMPVVDILQGPHQHNGVKVVRLAITKDGLDVAKACGVLTNDEMLAVGDMLLGAIVARKQARK